MPLLHSVIIDGRDLTSQIETLSFSNVDPGGFEVMQSEQLGSLGVRAGAPAAVLLGGNYAWHGRINEKGENDERHTIGNVAGVGYGAKFKDNPFSMVYVDRDLGRWGQMSNARRANRMGATVVGFGDFSVLPDVNTGLPALQLRMTGAWAGEVDTEPWYDAGQGNVVGSVYVDHVVTNASYAALNFTETLRSAVTDDDTATVAITTFAALGAGYNDLAAVVRYVIFSLRNTAAGGTEGTDYLWVLRKVAVYGNHQLPRRGSDPGGFYASDIAADAAKRSKTNFNLVIKDDVPFIVPHSVYYAPTAADKIIGDMAVLQGYHWGVWEPNTLDDRPTFLYSAPSPEPTCQVSRRDCTGFRSPSIQYDKVYDTAIVSYSDPAGSSGFATVVLPHPLLLPGESRTIDLDMGVGSLAAATAFGTFALRLSQQSARGGGSATLPSMIALPGGGFKPSSLLRAGRDRIRILDLRDAGALLQSDLRGLDTFLIRRVETTIHPDGTPETRIEFDGGADLMEVLNARLAEAAVLAGA